ncbi:hypothetical protein [Paracoccus fontiphilus]|uniref:NAD dependent epimerase/dehydratase family protein n=1 Tax=Paracoccus fontiphilus TaxID=1815556 RepID=A0ABV7II53_9RHOB|nr:hypothetical protein [Paracoccus fontiphilus]
MGNPTAADFPGKQVDTVLHRSATWKIPAHAAGALQQVDHIDCCPFLYSTCFNRVRNTMKHVLVVGGCGFIGSHVVTA